MEPSADTKPPKYVCTACGKLVTATKNQRYRTHTDGSGENCRMSSEPIPPRELEAGDATGTDPGVPQEGRDYAKCPSCERNVPLTALGYYEDHKATLRGSERCKSGGTRYRRPESPAPVGPRDAGVPSSPSPSLPPEPERAPSAEEPSSPAVAGCPHDGHKAEECLVGQKVGGYQQPASVAEEDMWAGEEATPPSPTSSPGQTLPSSSTESTPSSTSSDFGSTDSSPSPSGSSPPSGIPGQRGTPWASSVPILNSSPRFSVDRYLQPDSPYLQPVEYVPLVKAEMGDHAKLLATRIRETFYAYSNRNTDDNRTAQVTMGPSEIGTPCNRRIAMNLMGVEPVNPGGDGWAAFVGTCTHEGMASIYRWASAQTGRYAVEAKLRFESTEVPHGTSDLFDRSEGDVVDWKVMGKYSLDKFKREGPSSTYRIQGHVYGLGQELAGEKVRNVAIVGLPRAGSELTDMHVWSEPYDRSVAEEALNRVRRIHAEVRHKQEEQANYGGLDINAHRLRIAREFDTGDDCKYCPFYRKKDAEMEAGCPGS